MKSTRHTVCKVNDGGKKLAPDEQPAHNWLCQTYRVLEVIDNQVGNLRKRQLIAGYPGSPI